MLEADVGLQREYHYLGRELAKDHVPDDTDLAMGLSAFHIAEARVSVPLEPVTVSWVRRLWGWLSGHPPAAPVVYRIARRGSTEPRLQAVLTVRRAANGEFHPAPVETSPPVTAGPTALRVAHTLT